MDPQKFTSSRKMSLFNTRNLIIGGTLLFVALVCAVGLQGRYISTKEKTQGRYNTIAHQFLELEKEYGWEISSYSYQLLDSLIDQAIERIMYNYGLGTDYNKQKAIDLFRRRNYSKKDGELILTIIDKVLNDNNFLHRPTALLTATLTGKKLDNDVKRIIRDKGEMVTSRTSADNLDISSYVNSSERESQIRTFLNENSEKVDHILKHLDDKYHFTDCYTTTAIYLGIADVLNLPINSVAIPNHVFLRWRYNGTMYFDWEETRGRRFNDDSYFKLSGIGPNDAVVKNGVYFRSQKMDENFSTRYILLGNIALQNGLSSRQHRKKQIYFNKALGLFEKALEYNPTFKVAHNNIGNVYENMGDIASQQKNKEAAVKYYEKAMDSYSKVLDVYPRNHELLKHQKYLQKRIHFL